MELYTPLDQIKLRTKTKGGIGRWQKLTLSRDQIINAKTTAQKPSLLLRMRFLLYALVRDH
jgi:hypothetical protein